KYFQTRYPIMGTSASARKSDTIPFDELIERLRGDDAAAWLYVYDQFLPRAVSALRKSFGVGGCPSDIREDCARSAWRTLKRRLTSGEFENPEDEHQLAALLVTIAMRKCAKAARWYRRNVQTGGPEADAGSDPGPLKSVASPDRGPIQEAIR